jgi:hypothetical protein
MQLTELNLRQLDRSPSLSPSPSPPQSPSSQVEDIKAYLFAYLRAREKERPETHDHYRNTGLYIQDGDVRYRGDSADGNSLSFWKRQLKTIERKYPSRDDAKRTGQLPVEIDLVGQTEQNRVDTYNQSLERKFRDCASFSHVLSGSC